jgi:hypothetical protein
MSNTLPRQSNETEAAHQRRVRKHITKNAPAEHRYYVHGGKPGEKGQRWIVPGMFIVLGLFFAVSGYLLNADIRAVNGPNGAQGEFVVQNLSKQYNESAKNNTEYLPVVTVRDEAIIPLNSKPHENTYAVGDTVKLRYSQQGKVVASFLNKDGEAESAQSHVLTAMGGVIVVIGLLVAKFYRGAVDPEYVEKELAKLTK